MAKPKIYYQLVTVGSPYFIWELEIALRAYPSIGTVSVDKVNTHNPVLYLYYGQSALDRTNSGAYPLLRWANNGKVMAVIKDVNNFYDYIPKDLEKINAFELADATGIESLKNYILQYFGFIETTRKVFLSYYRREASDMANQLFDALVRHRFKPFLDSYVIESGVNFQEHLHHELADCDTMILINTRGFKGRPWCMEEVKYAKVNNIGVIQIVINNSEPFNDLVNTDQIQLKNVRKKLSKLQIGQVLDMVERMRAKNFVYRQQALCNRITLACYGDILEHKEHGIIVNRTKNQTYYPCVSIPQSQLIQKAEKWMEDIDKTDGYSLRLLFDANSCRTDVMKHFDWLNGQLKVTTFDINQDFKL